MAGYKLCILSWWVSWELGSNRETHPRQMSATATRKGVCQRQRKRWITLSWRTKGDITNQWKVQKITCLSFHASLKQHNSLTKLHNLKLTADLKSSAVTLVGVALKLVFLKSPLRQKVIKSSVDELHPKGVTGVLIDTPKCVTLVKSVKVDIHLSPCLKQMKQMKQRWFASSQWILIWWVWLPAYGGSTTYVGGLIQAS